MCVLVIIFIPFPVIIRIDIPYGGQILVFIQYNSFILGLGKHFRA